MKTRPPFNLFAVKPYDELNMSYALSRLSSLSLAGWDEGLKPSEGHAVRVPYQNQQLLPEHLAHLSPVGRFHSEIQMQEQPEVEHQLILHLIDSIQ